MFFIKFVPRRFLNDINMIFKFIWKSIEDCQAKWSSLIK